MPFTLACPHCSQTMTIQDSQAGSVVRCPACNGAMSVPALELPDESSFLPAPQYRRKPRGNGVAIAIAVGLFGLLVAAGVGVAMWATDRGKEQPREVVEQRGVDTGIDVPKVDAKADVLKKAVPPIKSPEIQIPAEAPAPRQIEIQKPMKSKVEKAAARWERRIEPEREAFERMLKAMDRTIKEYEAEVERAKTNPKARFAKKIKECEEAVRRAKEAADFAIKQNDPLKIKDTKKYLEKTEGLLVDAKNAPIEAARSDLNAAIAAKNSLRFKEPRFFPTSLDVGDVGKICDENGFDVVFVVTQVLDGENALIRFRDKIYWGEFRTFGVADGDMVSLNGLIEVTETRQYKTVAGGTNTVRVFHEYPLR